MKKNTIYIHCWYEICTCYTKNHDLSIKILSISNIFSIFAHFFFTNIIKDEYWNTGKSPKNSRSSRVFSDNYAQCAIAKTFTDILYLMQFQ